jgi:axial budding pattern protein 2
MFLFLLLGSLVAFTVAAPTASTSRLVLAKPLRSQLPLIARVGSPYTWSISTSTFLIEDDQGHNTPIAYNASGLPQWLSFSTSTLSFTGTVPTSALPGTIPITITASIASTADSSSDSFDFLISTKTPPKLAIPLTQQFYDGNPAVSGAFVVNPSSALAPYYTAATPREGSSSIGLRIPPTFEFSIGLQGATFAPWPLHYYASLVGGAPLPEWMKYNQGSFTFDGTAPDYVDGALPEPMEVAIEASDAEGYSAGPAARQSFWLTIASHELKVKDGSRGIERNVSVGTGFVLDLMDGPDDNPWMGEVFWDAGFLPKDGIQKVSMVSLLAYLAKCRLPMMTEFNPRT